MVLPYVITNAVEIARLYAVQFADQVLGYGHHIVNKVSATPVPEAPAHIVPLGLFAALAASAWLLRKRNLNVPVLMK